MPPFWFAGMARALFAAMDAHAVVVEREVATTSVKEKVFRRLGFALSEKFPVLILGDARLGKTASVSTWCKMRPGVARLVTVPESNDEADFIEAIALALGIPHSPDRNRRDLKRAVLFTLAHTGLFLVFDEFHYAIPVRVTRKAVPHRLNWIRANVVDKGLGCAFLATRQTYNATMDKFVSETKYVMDQWIGRVAAPLVLDEILHEKDLLNIARAKYPDVDGDILELIVGWCMSCEEAEARKAKGQHTAAGAAQRQLFPVVANARYLAQQAGTEITLEIAMEAWREMTGNNAPGQMEPGMAEPPARPLGAAAAPAPRAPRAARQVRPENVAPLPLEQGRNLDLAPDALAVG